MGTNCSTVCDAVLGNNPFEFNDNSSWYKIENSSTSKETELNKKISSKEQTKKKRGPSYGGSIVICTTTQKEIFYQQLYQKMIQVNLIKQKKQRSPLDQMQLILRVQSLWRAYKIRKQRLASTVIYSERRLLQNRHLYFTEEEFWETISPTKIYSPDEPRLRRKYRYKHSKAVYNGEFKGGLRDGKGLMQWSDGTQYEGEWKDGRANGQGTFTNIAGDTYTGSWYRDRAHGYGVFSTKEGKASYCGQWRNDQQEGLGEEKWPDGSTYNGSYKDGLKEGFGIYTWENGSIFQGQWSQNQINGIVRKNLIVNLSMSRVSVICIFQCLFYVQSWTDGRKYLGEFLDNMKHGFGHFTYSDGTQYIGQFDNDQKQGYGHYIWEDHRYYQGWWHQGKQHGFGRLTKSNKTKIGAWQEGKRLKWIDDDIEVKKLEGFDERMAFIRQTLTKMPLQVTTQS